MSFTPLPLEDAKDWFNVSVYKRLAKRLLHEALTTEIEFNRDYDLPFLERYCAARKLVLIGLVKSLKKGMICYDYLKIGGFIFHLSKLDATNYRIKYRLINPNFEAQLQLFNDKEE